jgi:hypothetical protein
MTDRESVLRAELRELSGYESGTEYQSNFAAVDADEVRRDTMHATRGGG